MNEQLAIDIWKRIPWRAIPHLRNFRTDVRQRRTFAVICEPGQGTYIAIAWELDEIAANYIVSLHNANCPEMPAAQAG